MSIWVSTIYTNWQRESVVLGDGFQPYLEIARMKSGVFSRKALPQNYGWA